MSTPYLTPPPTVPTTRQQSVARPALPATLLHTTSFGSLPPLSAGLTPRFGLPYPASHSHPHSPSSYPLPYPHSSVGPYPYHPISTYSGLPNPLPRIHPPTTSYLMPTLQQSDTSALMRSLPLPAPTPHPVICLADIQPIPDDIIAAAITTSRDELEDSPPVSPNVRAEKRRRTKKNPTGAANGSSDAGGRAPSSGSGGPGASPHSNDSAAGDHLAPPGGPGGPGGLQQRRTSGLAPIKPIGFAASRESRRESSNAGAPGAAVGDAPVPSPVVMGFDFQKVDEDQLKTVRDTISIKAQQEALIAQRRRDLAASTPNTPKELTFKGWQPKDHRMPGGPESPIIGSGGVGRRREKTRDKVERMSIVTVGPSGNDVVPGSKSAPMNQGLSVQQPSADMPSGSQTSLPPGMPGQHTNGPIDPRNAPVSNVRGSRGDEGEFMRQQAVPVTGQYYRRYDTGHGRSVTEGGQRSGIRVMQSASRGYDDRMPPPVSGNPSRNGHPGPSAAYTTQDHSDGSASPPPSRSHHNPPVSAMSHQPLSGLTGPSTASLGPGAANASLVVGGLPPISARREAFLAPYNQLYDLLHQTDSLRYSLQELMHRYEGAYASQLSVMHDFKGTAASANTLLNNLQQSAESLKEMVRYEVARAIPAQQQQQQQAQQAQVNGTATSASGAPSSTTTSASDKDKDKKELEELRERIKVLEERSSASKDK